MDITYYKGKKEKSKNKDILKIMKMQNMNNKNNKKKDIKIQSLKKKKNNPSIYFKSNEKLIKITSNKNKTKEIIDLEEQLMKKTDNEINFLGYENAIKKDKRTFFEYYLSLIRIKQILIFTFYQGNHFNSRIIKICFLYFIFILFFVVNTLFINDSTFHSLYMLNGSINYKEHFPIIMYSTTVCYFLKKIFSWLIFTEIDILAIRKNDGVDKNVKANKIFVRINIKYILFFSIGLFLLLLFWVYMTCFCAIFRNTQIFIIKINFISFAIFLVLPFILNLIPPIFRIASLKKHEYNNKRKKFLYKFSQIIQLII